MNRIQTCFAKQRLRNLSYAVLRVLENQNLNAFSKTCLQGLVVLNPGINENDFICNLAGVSFHAQWGDASCGVGLIALV